MRFTKNTQNTTRLKCCACHEKWLWTRPKCCACTKTATHLLKTSQKYCACHAKRFSTRCTTRLNVTKCHACHAKRSNDTPDTSKNDHLCKTYHRHRHTVLTRTVADGCGRERNVERTHPQPPDPQSETGTLATHSGKMDTNGQIYAMSPLPPSNSWKLLVIALGWTAQIALLCDRCVYAILRVAKASQFQWIIIAFPTQNASFAGKYFSFGQIRIAKWSSC